MDPETLFSLAGMAVLPGWLLLVFCPFWRWSTGLIPAVILPGLRPRAVCRTHRNEHARCRRRLRVAR